MNRLLVDRAALPDVGHRADPLFAPELPRPGGRAGAAPDLRRVLLLVTELEDYTIAFANGVAAHVPVTLAVPRRQYARLSEWVGPGVDLVLMDWPRHRSLAYPRFLAALAALVRRTRPDVIHLLSNNTLWLNLLAPLRGRIPLVTTVHDISAHPGDWDTGVLPVWSTTWMARQSDHLVVHGETLRGLAQAQFGKAPERVHVLSHPAITRYGEIARRNGLARRPARPGPTILLFGRIFAYKGLQTLIRAEAHLQARLPGLRVVIAGRGDDPAALRKLMGDPGRYDIRHRFIEDAEVAQLFLDADMVALPYSEGSQSGVLHLAAAFGKPVVATDVGEIGATVAARSVGLVVPPGDPVRFARAICDLATTPRLAEACGGAALAWAATDCAPETVGAAAAAIYRNALEVARR